jgi:DNA repair exonuclease SbcCD nuclease subunit
MTCVRILLTADSHLGLDLPQRPRVQRRRRGNDLFDNYLRVLWEARQHKVDAIIHAGDLFFRSRVPAHLVAQVFAPLKQVADEGIAVFIVPGNHENGRIPHSELSFHPGLKVFSRPTTYAFKKRGHTLAISGFPFIRNQIRDRFKAIVAATQWQRTSAHRRLLCFHHCVEGAIVGPVGYVFRRGADVIRLQDIPPGFSALLTGHIHRCQVLEKDLRGKAIAAPVLYPGAIERISFAEKEEYKGYLLLTLDLSARCDRRPLRWRFQRLPTRPMVSLDLRPDAMAPKALVDLLQERLAALPADAIVRLKLHGPVPAPQQQILNARSLRRLAPASMNIHPTWVPIPCR